MKKVVTFLLMAFLFFVLSACGQEEFEASQLNEGEFFLEVDYSKKISEKIDEGQFGLIDKRIGDNFVVSPEDSSKKVRVIATIICFNIALRSYEANNWLQQDGTYRGANFSELVALSEKFPYPYFELYPSEIDINNGWSLLNFNGGGDEYEGHNLIIALNASFIDYKSLPGYGPLMIAYIYDRGDMRTLELRQEFSSSEDFYSSAAFLVIRIK